jgi:hypothetical protein
LSGFERLAKFLAEAIKSFLKYLEFAGRKFLSITTSAKRGWQMSG